MREKEPIVSPRVLVIATIVVLSAIVFGGMYHFLTMPVPEPHEELGVIVRIYNKHTTCLSKRGLETNPHDIPFIDCELVGSKEIVSSEVSPYYCGSYSLGDTCVLWYNFGEYTYKRHK
ncbi:MAG: hypothetical protein IKP27_10710 [Paludibacteraceae bacterium]|nr:hypothetical protein [Paludibacteraceae bacterium]